MKHLPPGRLTAVTYYNQCVLTNLPPEEIRKEQPHAEIELWIMRDDSWLTDPNLPGHTLRNMGFYHGLERARRSAKEGKFVYCADGTFFLAHTAVPHMDVYNIPKTPARAVGAGFFICSPNNLTLYGTSFSLNGLPPCRDGTDYEAITKHLRVSAPVKT
jgi:hypothetical protein